MERPGFRVEQDGKPVLRHRARRPADHRGSRPSAPTHSSIPRMAPRSMAAMSATPRKRTSTTAAGPATATSTSPPKASSSAGSTPSGESLQNFPIPFAGNICGVSVDNEGFVWVGDKAAESVVKSSTPRTATRSERSASAPPASPAASRLMKETATCMSAPKTERSGSTRKPAATRPTFCWPKAPESSPSTRPKGSSTTSGPANRTPTSTASAPPMANRSRKSKP